MAGFNTNYRFPIYNSDGTVSSYNDEMADMFVFKDEFLTAGLWSFGSNGVYRKEGSRNHGFYKCNGGNIEYLNSNEDFVKKIQTMLQSKGFYIGQNGANGQMTPDTLISIMSIIENPQNPEPEKTQKPATPPQSVKQAATTTTKTPTTPQTPK